MLWPITLNCVLYNTDPIYTHTQIGHTHLITLRAFPKEQHLSWWPLTRATPYCPLKDPVLWLQTDLNTHTRTRVRMHTYTWQLNWWRHLLYLSLDGWRLKGKGEGPLCLHMSYCTRGHVGQAQLRLMLSEEWTKLTVRKSHMPTGLLAAFYLHLLVSIGVDCKKMWHGTIW